MAMDCEDSWNSTKDRRLSVSEKISKKVYKGFGKRFQNYGFVEKEARFIGLKKISEKVYKELNTSFVFGACYGNFLLKAPEYLTPILILPDFDIYERRWKKRNPNDKQGNNVRYRECQKIAEKNKNLLVLHQPHDECIDVTIYRICELIINNNNR